MKLLSLEQELSSNAYPGRGIVLGLTPDGTHAVAAYFIMGRSVNSRNRVFVEDGEGIRTQAFCYCIRPIGTGRNIHSLQQIQPNRCSSVQPVCRLP